MIRTKLAKKVLTKSDQRHLSKAAAVHSMRAFIASRKRQIEARGIYLALWKHNRSKAGIHSGFAKRRGEPCLDCYFIAQKLGIE